MNKYRRLYAEKLTAVLEKLYRENLKTAAMKNELRIFDPDENDVFVTVNKIDCVAAAVFFDRDTLIHVSMTVQCNDNEFKILSEYVPETDKYNVYACVEFDTLRYLTVDAHLIDLPAVTDYYASRTTDVEHFDALADSLLSQKDARADASEAPCQILKRNTPTALNTLLYVAENKKYIVPFKHANRVQSFIDKSKLYFAAYAYSVKYDYDAQTYCLVCDRYARTDSSLLLPSLSLPAAPCMIRVTTVYYMNTCAVTESAELTDTVPAPIARYAAFDEFIEKLKNMKTCE